MEEIFLIGLSTLKNCLKNNIIFINKMSYKKLKECWNSTIDYNLKENYNPITMLYPDWQKFISKGQNVMLLSGGIKPSGTVQTNFSSGGAVIKGHVRQGY